MSKRTNLNDYQTIRKVEDLDRDIVDKRQGKRSKAKKKRRNRHYVKNMLREWRKDADNQYYEEE
ncbi:MAG: hypothetical protein HRU40_15845 [Saprospiraceae bacterium]|nr:hypothetical protein [Saprospiraceae bacterium]